MYSFGHSCYKKYSSTNVKFRTPPLQKFFEILGEKNPRDHTVPGTKAAAPQRGWVTKEWVMSPRVLYTCSFSGTLRPCKPLSSPT